MTEEAFDWVNISTNYGSAARVPEAFREARECRDAALALEALDAISVFGLDNDTLTDASPLLAKNLLYEATRAASDGRAPWPYLEWVARLLGVVATLEDTIGLAPWLIDPASFDWNQGKRAQYSSTTRILLREIGRNVEDVATPLGQLVVNGAQLDKVHAASVLYLAGCLNAACPPSVLIQAIEGSTDDWERASLLLVLDGRRSDGVDGAVIDTLVSRLDSASPYERAACWAALQHQTHPVPERSRLETQEVLDLLDAANVSHEGYVWHRGLLAGEVCRAAYLSDLGQDEKGHIFESALRRETPKSEQGARPWQLAASASWYSMRLRLERHYHRSTPLDAPEIAPQESALLSALQDTRHLWLEDGSSYPGHFGMTHFLTSIPQLLTPKQALTVNLGTWPFEAGSSTAFSWLMRPLSFQYRSAQRKAAFELVARELAMELNDEELVRTLNDISSLPAYPCRELARAMRRELLLHRAKMDAVDELSDDAVTEKLNPLTLPRLVAELDGLAKKPS